GEITDVKFVKRADGVFRQIAFVGYKTEKEARAALKYFNGTYVDTSKIEVEVAKAIGDSTLPRAWSRHSKGSSAHQRKLDAEEEAIRQRKERQERIRQSREETQKDLERKQNAVKNLYGADVASAEGSTNNKEDEKLKEFLEVMRPRKAAQGRTWANDDVLAAREGRDAVLNGKKMKAKAVVSAVPNRKPGGDGLLVAKTHVVFGGASDDDEYEDLPPNKAEEEEKRSGEAKNGETEGAEDEEEEESRKESVAFDSGLSDLEYMKLRMKKLDEDVTMEDAEEEAEEEDIEKEEDEPESSSAPTTTSHHATVNADRLALMGGTAPTTTSQPSATTSTRSTAPPTSTPITATPAPTFTTQLDTPPAELIADTGRLFVKNLPFSCTMEDLHKLFQKFGPLSEVHIPIDKLTKKPKGYAFILYLLPEHAVRAYTELNGSIFQGRILEILPGKEKIR
ncbi:hypothetical protein HK097_005409, partial [Rhizophlyctis rosea]